ncbi:NAD-dependent DNA ligase LigA [Blattabacterium cuenoti]|uniref:NAD-dependent DNA ligase LigA n=1 Tax=Blattabacterium cuenoti TaxID=1653831 RepID=UPI00163CF59D|nr:NAD-dependent DNA ligase LigA [Blattabacterium cuenoti]
MDKKIKKKISQLRKKLSEYNDQYYNFDESKISDGDFDKKMRELYDLEQKFPHLSHSESPTIKIGFPVNKGPFKRYTYKYKMYSIQNCSSKEGLILWEQRMRKSITNFSFTCELKYDGVSINLIYENGILTHAITRGNGKQGEDVTEHIKNIPNFPMKLTGPLYPPYLEIRGEIFISIKNLREINKNRIKNGESLYSNPRNTASGILKNRNQIYKKHLSYVTFHAIGLEKEQYQSLKTLKTWGLIVPEHFCKCHNLQEVFHFLSYWETSRSLLPYQIDGIVIKVNEYRQQCILGYTKKYPRWSIAYKFRQKKISETKLIDMNFQVGRTGIITPVAQVHPISISGTVIRRVSLYNHRFIKKQELHHSDTILLEKGGDIIPIIKTINKQKRLKSSFPICFVKKCPSCKSLLIKKKELYYCHNDNCSSKIIMKLKHFSNDRAMNIKNIGHKIIEKLYQHGIVSNFFDFFQIKKTDLLKIEGIEEGLANKIITNIQISKNTPYHKVLYALGIRYVGEHISQKLTEKFSNIHELISANYEDLLAIHGVGEEIAKSILNFFSKQENLAMIQRLIQCGLHVSQLSPTKNQSLPLSGTSFVFTGKLSCMTRNQSKKMIESLGGRVFNTVNNKIDFIIIGKNCGSKLEKSMKKNHITILTEDHFIQMIRTKKLPPILEN